MANVSDKWIQGWLSQKDTDEFETQILETEARADEYDTIGGYDDEV